MSEDTFEKLSDITKRITGRLAPVTFIVPIDGPVAVQLFVYAAANGNKAETIIAEAVRAYLGDAA